MFSPELVVFAVLALVRMARATDKAVAQFARDRATSLPGIDLPKFDDDQFIHTMIVDDDLKRVQGDEILKEHWDRFNKGKPGDPGFEDSRAILFGEGMRIKARIADDLGGFGAYDAEELGAAFAIGQWRGGSGPPHPLASVALTLVDIGLEFVAREPSIVGAGKGEKLIGAFAANLAALIEPEKTALEFRKGFAERTVGLLLSAALTTLHENAELLVRDADWRKLVQNTLTPVIAAFPAGDFAGQDKAQKVADVLLGPVFKAAVGTIAESPAAFLGDAARMDTLPGVVIGAILDRAKAPGVDLPRQFTEDGLAALVKAVLGALASNADIVVKFKGDGTPDEAGLQKLARELVTEVLGTLSKVEWQGSVFSRDLGLKLAAAALTAVKNGAPALLDQKEPWKALATQLLEKVVNGLIDAAGGRLDVKNIAWTETLEQLGRIFIEQAAKTPAMIAGNNAELGRVVTAVAKAMGADTHLLLGRDGWLSLAALIAAEAAANPGRLFGVPLKGDADWVGEAVLVAVLTVAGKEFEARKDRGGRLLFGATLQEVISHTFITVSGNFAKLAELHSVATIEDTLRNTLNVITANPRRYGSRELLRVFKLALPKALATGVAPALEMADVETLLAKANT